MKFGQRLGLIGMLLAVGVTPQDAKTNNALIVLFFVSALIFMCSADGD